MKNKVVRLTEADLRRIVNYCLNEATGVSDEVTDASSETLSLILAMEKNTQWKESITLVDENGNALYYKKLKIYPEPDSVMNNFVKFVEVRMYGYNGKKRSSAEMNDYLLKKGYLKTSYSPSQRIIIISTPFPYDGNIDEYVRQYIFQSLNHEFKHALQAEKRNRMDISDHYINATKWYGNENIDLLKMGIRDCYYKLDSDEVDAALQEIYVELSRTGRLKDGTAYKRMEYALIGYAYCKNFINKNGEGKFQYILTKTLGEGITVRQFFNYCKKGLKRYNEHLKRIIGRWQQENQEYNGSFGQYANNEIPLQYKFNKTNMPLWKRLFGRFKK